MPEAKQALQNGAKELVIVRLENGSRAWINLNNDNETNILELKAKAEGIWGNDIWIQVLQGKANGTRRIDLYYQSNQPVETDKQVEIFDNLNLKLEDNRYLVSIINSQSELVIAKDCTLPGVIEKRRRLIGTNGVKSSTILTGTTGGATPAFNMIFIQSREFGMSGDNIKVTVEGGTNIGNNITVEDITDPESAVKYEDVVLDPDDKENYILANTKLGGSELITAELHVDYTAYTTGDSLEASENPLSGGIDRIPATSTLLDKDENKRILVTAKDPGDGTAGNNIYILLEQGSKDDLYILKVWYPGSDPQTPDKIYKDVNFDPDPENPDYIIKCVNEESTRIKLEYLPVLDLPAIMDAPQNLTNVDNTIPEFEQALLDFKKGLEDLEQVPDVDIVVPSIQYPSSFQDISFEYSNKIFTRVDAHCKLMSEAGSNRIGFGGVCRGEEELIEDKIIKRTATLSSDRFVIVAPHGIVGAVAGLVGNLTYYLSPTFKAISGIASLEYDFNTTDLRKLLENYIVPVAARKGLGIIIIRGLTTDGDQISVRRVADYAVRNVKGISERFIGNLNTQDGRDALKQKIIEFFQQMEKESAVVPSTDGLEPAFKVDVYSTQRDFALGIVRVDIAVRPVRAIDFIYATILVQV
jgi:hypothetical protein